MNIYLSTFLLFYMSTAVPVHQYNCSVYFFLFGITCSVTFQFICWSMYPFIYLKIYLPVYLHAFPLSNSKDLPVTTTTCITTCICNCSCPFLLGYGWKKRKKLKLNNDKTEAVHFSSSSSINMTLPHPQTISLSNTDVEFPGTICKLAACAVAHLSRLWPVARLLK